MNNFKNLRIGSIIRHKGSSKGYIITNDFGDRFTAVRTVEVSNPIEWDEINPNTGQGVG